MVRCYWVTERSRKNWAGSTFFKPTMFLFRQFHMRNFSSTIFLFIWDWWKTRLFRRQSVFLHFCRLYSAVGGSDVRRGTTRRTSPFVWAAIRKRPIGVLRGKVDVLAGVNVLRVVEEGGVWRAPVVVTMWVLVNVAFVMLSRDGMSTTDVRGSGFLEFCFCDRKIERKAIFIRFTEVVLKKIKLSPIFSGMLQVTKRVTPFLSLALNMQFVSMI